MNGIGRLRARVWRAFQALGDEVCTVDLVRWVWPRRQRSTSCITGGFVS
jgi:hypothetical protein